MYSSCFLLVLPAFSLYQIISGEVVNFMLCSGPSSRKARAEGIRGEHQGAKGAVVVELLGPVSNHLRVKRCNHVDRGADNV